VGGADDGATTTCNQDPALESLESSRQRERSHTATAGLTERLVGSIKRDGKSVGLAYSAHQSGARSLLPDTRDEGADPLSSSPRRDVEGGEHVVRRSWPRGGVESGADGSDGGPEEGESTAVHGQKSRGQGSFPAAHGKTAIPVSGGRRLRLPAMGYGATSRDAPTRRAIAVQQASTIVPRPALRGFVAWRKARLRPCAVRNGTTFTTERDGSDTMGCAATPEVDAHER
jgi:hypothetical protein